VLRETFVHLPGIGLQSERRLWEQGCTTWDDLLRTPSAFSYGSASAELVRREVERSVSALAEGRHQYFAKKLRQRDSWRSWPEFQSSCVYLDIETDGTNSPDSVTLIGMYDGASFTCLCRGEDLESFRDIVSRYAMIVTFFGTGFDIPVLERRFPSLGLDQIHLDLCVLLRNAGVRGGLKKIEAEFGIARSERTAGLTGYDAVKLWRAYERGRSDALETLIAYNREDVVNLEPLMKIAFDRLREATLKGESTGPRRSRRYSPLP